ncbi:MAG: 3-deoxy-D-manno-octulosonic acid transferase, partial [Paludibacteraceae bacterium]
MILYFCLIYIAAFFGHRKARLLVQGQRESLRRLRENDHICKDCVWFHAASVGEFEQARPIIERLKAEQPRQKILLTFFSPSGYEMRKHYDKADAVMYLPFATRRNARLFVETIRPRKAIFVKYEFWPAYLRLFKKKHIPAYSISAIFRPTQLFFRPWGKAYLDLLRCFRHIFVQDEASLRLLQTHGIGHCSVAGDTRFDRVNYLATHAAASDGELLPFEPHEKLLVAGSTWPKDEALLARYVDTHPDVSLLLVP